MKMKLSRKIAVFVGILIIVISVILGIIAIKLSSDALMKQTEESMLQYAQESANHIDAEISKNLTGLSEVALRARTATMDFAIQQESITPDIKRLGYESMGIVLPNGSERDLTTGEVVDLSDREYIKKALSGDACVSGVLISKVTGKPAVIEAAPIKLNNQVLGVLIGRRDANFLSSITNELGLGERGYAFIMGADSTIYAHPNEQDVLNQTNVFENMKTEENNGLGAKLKEIGLGKLGIAEYTRDSETRVVALAPIPNTDWTLGVGSYKDDITSGVTALRTIILIVALIVVALGVGMAVILGNVISRPIKNLSQIADKMALGEVDVAVNATTNDEIGDLMTSFGKMIDNIRNQSEVAERIANGDLTIEIVPRSKKDILSISMKSMADNLRALVNETQMLTASASEGDLTTRGNADSFHGGFKEIVEGINSTLDGIVDPLNVALLYIEKIANGEELEELENNYKGYYAALIDNLMKVRVSLYTLLSEADLLTKAAFDGEFAYTPDIALHKGGFAQIMKSICDAMDYLIAPLAKAGEYMRKIGNGEIPEKITDEYKGDFNDIKDSINACIDGLGGLVEGRDALVRMSLNDYSKDVEGYYLGIYADIAASINEVAARVRRTIGVINHIAEGDLSDIEALNATGKRSDNDTLVPALKKMNENIQALINEAAMLTNAAIEGQLDTRSDAKAFQGAWKDLVGGMNSILEEVAKPLQDVSDVMIAMSKGNFQVSVKGSYKGEFDVLTQSISTLISRLNSVVGEITATLGQIADGNLAIEQIQQFNGDFASITTSLNTIVDALNTVMGEISEAAEQVSAGAIQVSDGSQTLSQGSTEQASSIEELTSAITEVAGQTKQNAVNANQANDLATNAKDNAEKGNGRMQEMLQSMEDISESSANISKIIKVIDDIAFQTNILALNAAVEAARAGQHGKGFAVVAEEVRNLASRSAEAARDTTELIEGSINRVQAGTKIANDTAAALNEIVAKIEKAADLVGNIATASNEQASGIAQINKGIEQVSQVVQNNSATAEESAAASEELSGQAELLKEMVGKFKLREGKSLSGRDTRLLEDHSEYGTQKTATSGQRISFMNKESDKY